MFPFHLDFFGGVVGVVVGPARQIRTRLYQ